MMRPKSAMFYVNSIHGVAKEFVRHVRRRLLDPDGTNRGDFLRETQTYAFKSISLIALDHKLGAFEEEEEEGGGGGSARREEAKRMVQLNEELVSIFPRLAFGVPTWIFLPPR